MAVSLIVESVLRRDRLVVAAGLAAIVLLAWAYLLAGAGMDMSMPGMVMAPAAWSPAYGLLLFLMWWIMMIAMMVPSAAPIVLLYATLRRGRDAAASVSLDIALFLAGYLAIWAAFSMVATLLQWSLDLAGLMSMEMTVAGAILGGAILIAAGLYQFTPIKAACLRYCQSPVIFLSQHWRAGPAGAFRMGLRHGAYCLGCCWFLMALLFFAGAMNLLWIAGLAIYVALEKLLPVGPWLSRAAGVALGAMGGAVIAGVWQGRTRPRLPVST